MRTLALFALLAAPAAAQPDTLRLALRVDDVFMHDTDLLPQEIDSLVAVAERHGARLELAVIPERLLRPRNADGRMAAQLAAFVARGHAVSQHGWAHRHAPTGDTGAEFMDPATGAWLPGDTLLAQIGRGKRLLEAVTGKPVTKYVGPGTDRQTEPASTSVLTALGFGWITNPAVDRPTATDSLSYVPDLTDYTWALEEDSFDATLARAQADFEHARPTGYFAVGFHDHFTRHAWREGIVARWLDAFLTWAAAQPGTLVYVTADDLDAGTAVP